LNKSRSPLSDEKDQYEHGPAPVPRISPDQQEPGFLRSLQVRGEVASVPEDWDGSMDNLPASITWVVYPNGDLQRVGV
jgi:hypothetical protein